VDGEWWICKKPKDIYIYISINCAIGAAIYVHGKVFGGCIDYVKFILINIIK